MSDIINDLDQFLLIRTRLNAMHSAFVVATTDVLIAAGATTSIPVETIGQNLLLNNDQVTLVSATSGEAIVLTLAADVASGATALTVDSYLLLEDIPVGSHIYFKYTDLLTKIYPV